MSRIGWTLALFGLTAACGEVDVAPVRDAGSAVDRGTQAVGEAPADVGAVDVSTRDDLVADGGQDDAGPDVPIDAPVDVTVDAPAAAAVDAAFDAPVDASVDASSDAPVDARTDAAADAPVDAPVDAAPTGLFEVLVAAHGEWRYLDDGTAPPGAWSAAGFDDRAWRAGRAQLGFGDGDEATVVRFGPDPANKYITTYFRRRFAVADPRALRSAVLRIVRDDGAVVLLNGREVLRSNLPAGPLTAGTRALQIVGGADESAFVESALDPALLVAGENTLAVELHQSAPDSSDLSFDLELLGSRGPAFAPTGDPVLVGAGDIAQCNDDGDEDTARLLDAIPGTVFTLGDTAYFSGTDAEFADCYAPTWGRHRARTRPTVGNHEYNSPGAAGYYRYFGAAAGDPAEGYYSYDLGAWHVVVLNSNCAAVGGCDGGSPQDRWLVADLAAHPARCTLASWHHPRFSSGQHGSDAALDGFFRRLHAAGVEVLLTGHEHDYERFAPQDPSARPDPARGLREFVVGTGGIPLRTFLAPVANSEVRDASAHGVLRLVLHPDAYEWDFVPVAGRSFTDHGMTACH